MYVYDVVAMVLSLLNLAAQSDSMKHVFNAGGPQRLSRTDMARLVAVGRGYDLALVKAVPAASMVIPTHSDQP